MQINGFTIEQQNIYNLPEGVKYHTCPLCSADRKKSTQKCMSVFWDSGIGKCNHCGEVVQLHKFKKKKGPLNYKVPEWTNNTKLSDNVVKWFESRKIGQFVLRLMKIGEGPENMPHGKEWKVKNTIQFPYFRNGHAIDVKYRSGDKNFKLFKDAERIVYNLDNIQGQEVIYCVEGEPDVLAVMECGIHNVCSPPNGFTEKGNVNLDWINNDVEHFIKAKKIILVFDNDVPGENGKKEFIRRFGAHKCFIVDLNGFKDANDYLIENGPEDLKKALENHIEIPLENVSVYDDYKEKVRDFFLNGMPKGITTGNLGGLDENFSSEFGQIILVTGIPSMGKSEVVDQMTIGYAVKYGYNIGIASVENKPNELHFQKIVRKLNGIAPTDKNHFNDNFQACEKFANDHFVMIDLEDGYDLERVLLKAEELVYRKGIRILVLDPFNKIRHKGKIESITGNRTNDYTSVYLQTINDFAVKFNVIVLLVAHPTKMTKSENGKREIPDFYDVKGGGEFYDMCHHGIVVHRDYITDLTLIRTLKVKFAHLGENNKDAWFKYNVNNGRLCDVDGSPESMEGIQIQWDNENWVTRVVNQNDLNDIENDFGPIGNDIEIPF